MKDRRLICLALLACLLAGCAPGDSGSTAASSGGDVSSAPAQNDSISGVQVDWSRLEGDRPNIQPDVDGGRWYPDYTDHLIPRTDYGPLLPYQDGLAYSVARWEDDTGETQEYWSDWPSAFYGLMTQEGKIVVDPVYQNASLYTYHWQSDNLALPVLILSRADPAWVDSGGKRYAVAAEDGSWITDFAFLNYTNRGDQLLLVGLQGITQLDSVSGARTDWTWADLDVPEDRISEALETIQWFSGLTWTDHGVLISIDFGAPDHFDTAQYQIFQPETGESFWVEAHQWDEWQDEYYDQWLGSDWKIRQEGDQVTLSFNGETYVLPNAPPDCYQFYPEIRNGLVILEYDGGHQLRRLSNGEILLERTYIHFIPDNVHPEQLGCISVIADGNYVIYDANLSPVLTLPKAKEDYWLSCQLQDGMLLCYNDSSYDGAWFGCWDLDTGTCVFYRNLRSVD